MSKLANGKSASACNLAPIESGVFVDWLICQFVEVGCHPVPPFAGGNFVELDKICFNLLSSFTAFRMTGFDFPQIGDIPLPLITQISWSVTTPTKGAIPNRQMDK